MVFQRHLALLKINQSRGIGTRRSDLDTLHLHQLACSPAPFPYISRAVLGLGVKGPTNSWTFWIGSKTPSFGSGGKRSKDHEALPHAPQLRKASRVT